MGTYSSRRDYMDPSHNERHIWLEEKTVVDLLDEIGVDGNDDEHRDAIVKIVGDLRSKVAEHELGLIEARQQREKAEYDRAYAVGAIKSLLKELREDDSPASGRDEHE